MKNILKLMRVKHWLKNGLIFLPIVFAKELFNLDILLKTIPGFFAFCFLSSSIYILNDACDKEKDQNHPTKKMRPIASGAVSLKMAYGLMGVLFIGSCVLNVLTFSGYQGWISLGVYFAVNIGYSFGLKNVPILDVFLLVSGFFVRVFYGSAIAVVPISNWMYLTIIMISFYMGLGKRRNELLKNNGKETRGVLKYYNYAFLDKFMYLFLTLAIVFYSLWCVADTTVAGLGSNVIWTVPLVVAICMKYSLTVEGNSDADPVNVLLKDKVLLLFALAFVVAFMCLLYI